jgi:hypothetical protein
MAKTSLLGDDNSLDQNAEDDVKEELKFKSAPCRPKPIGRPASRGAHRSSCTPGWSSQAGGMGGGGEGLLQEGGSGRVWGQVWHSTVELCDFERGDPGDAPSGGRARRLPGGGGWVEGRVSGGARTGARNRQRGLLRRARTPRARHGPGGPRAAGRGAGRSTPSRPRRSTLPGLQRGAHCQSLACCHKLTISPCQ